jgi:hypothetical protein
VPLARGPANLCRPSRGRSQMVVLKRRARLVTFRLSNEEYELWEYVCISSGSRSISEFARSAVLYRVKMLGAPQGLLTEDLATLSEQLSELDGELDKLRGRIGRVLGSVQPEGKEKDRG